MFPLIAAAHAQVPATPVGPAAASPPGILEMLLPFIVVLAVFYFMLWRPQMQRQKETAAMLAQLAKGDEVVTAGGLTGRIRDLGPNFVLLEVSRGVEVKVQRSAITQTLPKDSLKAL
jgi:preprotein translocase subunit YajC